VATSTASFGTGKREGHDASGYYDRRMHIASDDRVVGELVDPPASIVDQLFHESSESMHQIPDNCVALMVTSPPYNVGKDYDDDLDIDEYLELLRRVFSETFRVLEPGGRVAVNVANLGRKPYIPLNQYVSALLTEIGFDLRNPTLRDIHEYVIVASKGSYARIRRGDDTISKEEFLDATVSIWNILPESARRVGHPAPFPVELPRRLIELYTFEGDLVLDPFLGSGTTAVAAVESGRRYVGYELNAGYIDIAERRIHEGRTGTRSVHV